NETAFNLSPTAEATRLRLPALTSPTANTWAGLFPGILSASRLIKHTNWLGAKSNCCDDREQSEKQENDELSKLKWLLRLRRSEHFQGWHFFERLHDADEDVEIERNHSADYVDPTPVAGELPRVAREDRNRE